METNKPTWLELMADAAKARREADRYHRATIIINDPMVEETLRARETELIKLAESLEAQAAKVASD